MRHVVDARLLDEARTFSLRFACEDCAHFDAKRDACTHGYTERPNRSDLESRATLAFCKEFEMDSRAGG
jgi:hypothetical protein